MPRTTFVILSVAVALVLIGCSKSETTNNSNSTMGSTEKPASSSPASETASRATTGDKIGIAECDDFIAKYESCVSNKVPAVARAQYESTLKTWRAEWKKAADNPQARGTLTATCKQIAEQQAAAFKAFGCSF